MREPTLSLQSMANIRAVEMSLTKNVSEENLPDTPPPEYESLLEEVKIPVAPSAADVAIVLDRPPDYVLYDEDGKSQKGDVLSEGSDDPWEMPELKDTGVAWSDLDRCGKVKRVVVEWVGKAVCLLALLYLFICSLDFLSSAFRLLGGKLAGEAFTDSELIQNPIAGLMLGIIATVLVQSSSTSTSIVVTMVASGILEVRPAIPIIMGANIGTSVTNTLVSLAQSGDKSEFRRAFAGAVVHDMFNWLTVLILLPIESVSGYLYLLSDLCVKSFKLQTEDTNKDMLKVITKPFTKLVIQLDKAVIEGIALGDRTFMNKSMIKVWCKYEKHIVETNVTSEKNVSVSEGVFSMENVTQLVNQTQKVGIEKCEFLFVHAAHLGDSIIGIILLAFALLLLCTCLILMVKILHSILKGRIAKAIKKTVNSDIPGKLSFLTGYIAIIVGAGMTILVQSSSIFTSALTPLVGIGVISLDRMYPLTLGSNIGTTATSLLAALASSSDRLPSAIQIGLCHLFFNISGILLFYPIPHLRKIPIKMAKGLGNITADYRWFPVFYLLMMFIVLPGTLFGLSSAGTIPFLSVVVPISILIVFIVIVNILQNKRPGVLPAQLRTWEFLPECMHSLDPLDRQLKKMGACLHRVFPCCCKPSKPALSSESASVASSQTELRFISSNSSADCSLLHSNMSERSFPSNRSEASFHSNRSEASFRSADSTDLLLKVTSI